MTDTIRSRCKTYNPKNMPELTLFYVTLPGEVDILDADINGCQMSECLYGLVIDDYRSNWEAEIEAHERKEAEDMSTDQAGI